MKKPVLYPSNDGNNAIMLRSSDNEVKRGELRQSYAITVRLPVSLDTKRWDPQLAWTGPCGTKRRC